MTEVVLVTDDEDMADVSDTGLNATKLAAQDADECVRTARMLKRQRLRLGPVSNSSGIKPEEEKELKEQRLLEDGMTKKMKLDLLKVLAESRKSAEMESSMRNVSPENVSNISTTVPKPLPVPVIDDGSLMFDSPLLFDSSQSGASAKNSPLKNENSLQTDQTEELSSNNIQKEIQLVDKRKFLDIRSLPFIRPDGVDPDEHAKVILEQMNGYHEYLKVQQRQSLNLMEWGKPITATGSVTLVKRREYSSSRSSLSNIKEAPLSQSSTSFAIEIESYSSSESSHEEFVVGKKSTAKNIKKTRAKKVPAKFAGYQTRGTKIDQLDSDLKVKATLKDAQCSLLPVHEDLDDSEEELPSSKSWFLKRKVLKKTSNDTIDKQNKSVDKIGPAKDAEKSEDIEEDPLVPSKAMKLRANISHEKKQGAATDVFDFESSQDSEVTCPVCDKQFSKDVIEAHASDCFTTSDNETAQKINVQSERKIMNSSDTVDCYICLKSFPLNVYDDHLDNCKF